MSKAILRITVCPHCNEELSVQVATLNVERLAHALALSFIGYQDQEIGTRERARRIATEYAHLETNE